MPPSRNIAPVVHLGDITNDGGFFAAYHGIITSENAVLYSGEKGCYGYPNFPPDRNVGSHFELVGTKRTSGTVSADVRGNFFDNPHYKGILVDNTGDLNYPNSVDGSSWGAEAYAKMKPAKPSFAGLNALYELKDLPGMLKQRLSDSPLRNIGNYYLGLKFGWEPLLRDIRNLISTQKRMQDRINQLLRDNGRPVRRRITIAENVTIDEDITASNYDSILPIFNTRYYPMEGGHRTITRTIDRIWASARFRYWLPGGSRDVNYRRKLMFNLYGLTPTPSVIYNMVPWSWLVDWFSNTGDILSNMDSGVADRLAADYFYVMRERKTIREHTAFQWYYDQIMNPIRHSTSGTSEAFVKTRLPGDPFGWNTSEDSLSSMQLSILGALGLSRLR